MTSPPRIVPKARRMPAADLAAHLADQAAMTQGRMAAEAVLETAKAEAAALLEEARRSAEAEAHDIRQAAECARDALLGEARSEARAIRLTEAAAAATRLADRFDALVPWMSNLVFRCVERIVGDLDRTARQQGLLTQALADARRDWSVRLRCAPAAAAELRTIIAADAGPEGRFRAVSEVVEDDRLSADDCLLESEGGLDEIGITAQLAALRQLLEADAPRPEAGRDQVFGHNEAAP